jgi:N-formylglutamate amidohydrolase
LTPDALPPPHIHQQHGALPVLLSVPHSGRDYPDWLVDIARSGRAPLERLEDPYVDRLIWRALKLGCGAVVARAPRAAIDCNRGEEEVDPAVIAHSGGRAVGARARGGLGIVPARTHADGYLWRRSITPIQLEERVEAAHRPYHRAIEAELMGLRDRFGAAVLIDCHSMPPPRDAGPGVIIGDRHGRSAGDWLTGEALAIVRSEGFSAGLNDPFAGGYVLERHGNPEHGIHALQIEIDRRLYLDKDLAVPGPGFDRLARLIETLAARLGEAVAGLPAATAAE